jgi:integrase/recombinase XerD
LSDSLECVAERERTVSEIMPRGELVDPFTSPEVPTYQRVRLAFLASYRNENTRTNYDLGLRAWFDWCLTRGLDPLEDVSRPHIETWLRFMEERQGLAARTIAGRCNALSGYYRIAVCDGYRADTPMAFVKRPRIERLSSTDAPSRTELHAMLKLAEAHSMRDLAILCLLGLNGLRCSEVVGIDIEDIEVERGYKLITIRRKFDRVQRIPLAYRAAWAVEETIGGRTNGPLFVSMRNPDARIGRGDVQRMVKGYARKAGIVKKSISPHSLRHAFVTLSLNAGVSPRDVQHSAGHTDPRSTSYYDRKRTDHTTNATHTLTAFVEGAD